MAKVLLLGGTEEARQIAEWLEERGADFVTSLAGRTEAHTVGPVRVGGFGGSEGLTTFIADEGFTVLVDATHPYAAEISPAAKQAARAARIKYLRIERMPWRRAMGDRWNTVSSLEEAAERIDAGSIVFLTVGAGGIGPFLARRDLALVVRAIAEPDLRGRSDVTVLRDRGPFDVDAERALFARYNFDTMVTKNAGGEATAAKLIAARERHTLVYMVRRPKGQPRPSARTVDKLCRKLKRHL